MAAEHSRDTTDWITSILVVLHGGAWLSMWAVLYYIVPAQKKIMEDFYIETLDDGLLRLLFALSDWVVVYYQFLAVPFVLLLAFDAYAISVLRSMAAKLTWTVVGLLVPSFVIANALMAEAAVNRMLDHL